MGVGVRVPFPAKDFVMYSENDYYPDLGDWPLAKFEELSSPEPTIESEPTHPTRILESQQ